MIAIVKTSGLAQAGIVFVPIWNLLLDPGTLAAIYPVLALNMSL